jgi:hypothetical protein
LIAYEHFRVSSADKHKKKQGIGGGGDLQNVAGENNCRFVRIGLDEFKNLFEFVRNNKTPADEESVDAGAGCLPHKIRKPLRIDFIRIDEEQIAASVLLFDL